MVEQRAAKALVTPGTAPTEHLIELRDRAQFDRNRTISLSQFADRSIAIQLHEQEFSDVYASGRTAT